MMQLLTLCNAKKAYMIYLSPLAIFNKLILYKKFNYLIKIKNNNNFVKNVIKLYPVWACV